MLKLFIEILKLLNVLLFFLNFLFKLNTFLFNFLLYLYSLLLYDNSIIFLSIQKIGDSPFVHFLHFCMEGNNFVNESIFIMIIRFDIWGSVSIIKLFDFFPNLCPYSEQFKESFFFLFLDIFDLAIIFNFFDIDNNFRPQPRPIFNRGIAILTVPLPSTAPLQSYLRKRITILITFDSINYLLFRIH